MKSKNLVSQARREVLEKRKLLQQKVSLWEIRAIPATPKACQRRTSIRAFLRNSSAQLLN